MEEGDSIHFGWFDIAGKYCNYITGCPDYDGDGYNELNTTINSVNAFSTKQEIVGVRFKPGGASKSDLEQVQNVLTNGSYLFVKATLNATHQTEIINISANLRVYLAIRHSSPGSHGYIECSDCSLMYWKDENGVWHNKTLSPFSEPSVNRWGFGDGEGIPLPLNFITDINITYPIIYFNVTSSNLSTEKPVVIDETYANPKTIYWIKNDTLFWNITTKPPFNFNSTYTLPTISGFSYVSSTVTFNKTTGYYFCGSNATCTGAAGQENAYDGSFDTYYQLYSSSNMNVSDVVGKQVYTMYIYFKSHPRDSGSAFYLWNYNTNNWDIQTHGMCTNPNGNACSPGTEICQGFDFICPYTITGKDYIKNGIMRWMYVEGNDGLRRGDVYETKIAFLMGENNVPLSDFSLTRDGTNITQYNSNVLDSDGDGVENIIISHNYSSPAPLITINEIKDNYYRKNITISSEIEFTNITINLTVDDVNYKDFKLLDGSGNDITNNITYNFTYNPNSHTVSWIIPHLSTQTYIIEGKVSFVPKCSKDSDCGSSYCDYNSHTYKKPECKNAGTDKSYCDWVDDYGSYCLKCMHCGDGVINCDENVFNCPKDVPVPPYTNVIAGFLIVFLACVIVFLIVKG
jgi:hypothetical protein